MDANAFDALSRVIGAGMTRQRFFQLLAGLGAARLTATAGVEVSAARNRRRRRRRRRNAGCPPDKKNAVCHCPPGEGVTQCKINCVGTGGGHDKDPFDCMCAGSIQGVPDCASEARHCPQNPGENERCGGPTTCTGTCTTPEDCPFNSISGCTCYLQQCVLCIEDGQPASPTAPCCSGETCPTDNICGQCLPVTCAEACSDQATCDERGGNLCRCLGLAPPADGTCGQCIPDTQPAGNAAECCSREICQGICGACAAQTCPASCPCGCPAGSDICTSPCPPLPKPRRNRRKKGRCAADRASGNGCNTNCQCKSNRCQNRKCCDPKGNHCRSDSECCSGTCLWAHSPDRIGNPNEDRQCA